VQVLAHCGAFERVQVFDADVARAAEVSAWARETLGLECTVAPILKVATLASDVVVTCTSSRIPFLKSGEVRPGTLVAAVGADSERKSEIDASLLAEARMVADLAAQCRKIGDLRNAMPNECFVCGDMVDLVAGRVARTAGDEIVVFDSTGLAVEDLALCELVLDPARGSGVA
jgi:ornithine cyclodeaminase/alanine dehydrogenase-like protein (mu-crystallin family)